MNQKTIPPLWYADLAMLKAELQQIFSPAWIWVGMTEQVARPGDFITLDLAGLSIVVQRFEAGLRAFHNVCSHRGARIQIEECGHRALVCPYHGWSYNADGVPIGISDNARQFGFDRQGREGLALTAFQVECLGRFVFVRMTADGPSLGEYLSPHAEDMKRWSTLFTEHAETAAHVWEADWKIGVQNALEAYHLRHIHPDSFARIFADDDLVVSLQGRHSSYDGTLVEETQRYWRGIAERLKLRFDTVYPGYRNVFIWPNLVLTLSAGASLTVQSIDPVAPGRLRFRSRLYLPAKPTGRARAAFKAVADNLREFSVTVRSEDQGVCEDLQSGAAYITRPPIFAKSEARVAHFHAVYMADIQPPEH